MTRTPPLLQELIVRALVSRETTARRSLNRIAQADPEVLKLCMELEQVVESLASCSDWRIAGPSAELSNQIRRAVVKRFPAPRHFETIRLRPDLKQNKRPGTLIWIGIVIAFILCWAILQRAPQHSQAPFTLKGHTAYSNSLQDGPFSDWRVTGPGAWSSSPIGLRHAGPAAPGAVYHKQGFMTKKGLGFTINIRLPKLDEATNAMVFLAQSADLDAPAFNPGLRPAQALTLELSRDSLVVYDSRGTLLHSGALPKPDGKLYRIRLEHFGASARILVNGNILYAGQVTRPMWGPLHPGIRISGPKKDKITFNSAQVLR